MEFGLYNSIVGLRPFYCQLPIAFNNPIVKRWTQLRKPFPCQLQKCLHGIMPRRCMRPSGFNVNVRRLMPSAGSFDCSYPESAGEVAKL